MKQLLIIALLTISFNARSQVVNPKELPKKLSLDSVYTNTPLLTPIDMVTLKDYFNSKKEKKDYRDMIAIETVMGAITDMLSKAIEDFYKQHSNQRTQTASQSKK